MVDGCASNYDLILAVREGKLERTRELINIFGLSKEWSDGYVLLCEALKKKHMSIARLLLDYGCRVNCENSENATFDTPLHYAVVCGDEEIVKIVLDKGAWIYAETKSDSKQPTWKKNDGTEFVPKGCTPLHTAVTYNQEGIVNLLIIYKADVNAQNKSGNTPLHIAAKTGNKKIVELLLENGATPDLRDMSGETALHRACDVRYSNCRIEVIAALLEFGFDINITSWNGLTPLGFLLHNSLRNLVRSDIEVAEYIVCHITKMKVANLYVREKNLPIVNKIKKYLIWGGFLDEGNFLDQCMRELERLKDQKVCLCTISFYDILTKKANSLAMLMRNENLVTALKTTDYTIEFPLYATIIKNHFRKGMERKELLQLGHRSFNSLLNNLTDLPYDCTEQILRYLSNKDLKNLIDTFKSHCIN